MPNCRPTIRRHRLGRVLKGDGFAIGQDIACDLIEIMVALKIVDRLLKRCLSADLLLKHLINVVSVGAKMLCDRTGILLVPGLDITRYKRGGFDFFHEFRRCAGETGQNLLSE